MTRIGIGAAVKNAVRKASRSTAPESLGKATSMPSVNMLGRPCLCRVARAVGLGLASVTFRRRRRRLLASVVAGRAVLGEAVYLRMASTIDRATVVLGRAWWLNLVRITVC